MTKRTLFALLFIFCIWTTQAQAQLSGTDTKPGDSCTASEEGYIRRNASAARDESEITLICDGTTWQSAGGSDTLAGLSCTDGQVAKWNNGAIAWECADLSNLNASNLTSGTVPNARFPATLPAASGVNLTNLNASNLASGTVGTARLGSGTADNTTYLRGDGTWAAPSGGGSGPSGCLLEGQFCDDGTILAGVIGNEVFYVTDTNQSTSRWATVNQTNGGARSLSDGQANHAWIVANRTLSQYPAFQLCENLNRHGHSDWYLPSRDELNVMYGNKEAIGGFTSGSHWSSTEFSNSYAWRQHFDDGFHGGTSKSGIYVVRCVRRN